MKRRRNLQNFSRKTSQLSIFLLAGGCEVMGVVKIAIPENENDLGINQGP